LVLLSQSAEYPTWLFFKHRKALREAPEHSKIHQKRASAPSCSNSSIVQAEILLFFQLFASLKGRNGD
ncbi:hypothetical protein, partial [Paracoccus aestuarii]|uniref:hypothetical protein n=1 Tax=Paracoccus aestuarii TaxID=453842 RepID=UPI0019826034